VLSAGERDGYVIVLARTPPFALGDLQVNPPTREVIRDGESEILEPRVMQVLVALAQAEGRVVCRDELIDRCWEGRIVGDNAVTRTIAQIRRLANEFAGGRFSLETITKVGYRLHVDEPGRPVHQEPSPLLKRRSALRYPATVVRHGLGVGLVLAILVGLVFFLRSPTGTSPPLLSVVAQPDSGSEALARQIEADVLRFASARGGFLAVTSKPGDADFVLQVERVILAAGEALDLRLATNRPTQLLWSTSLQHGPSADVRGEAAAKLAEVLLCAVRGATSRQIRREALSIYMAACDKTAERIGAGEHGADQQLISLLEQVTRIAPAFSWASGELALAEANRYLYLHNSAGRDATDTQAALAKARDRIARARELDPQLASIFLAESALLSSGTYKERLELLERGIEKNPEEPSLYSEYSNTLFEVGRLTDAILAAEQAVRLDPLSLKARATLVDGLAHAGSVVRARKELTAAKQLWPNSQLLRTTLFSVELRYGDPRIAQQMIDRGEASLAGPSGGFGGPEILMRARLDPNPQNLREMARLSSGQVRKGSPPVAHRIQALAHAGAVEEFYSLVGQPKVAEFLPSEVLFRPHLKPFRDDVRFMTLARQLGLVEYWTSSRRWPDFCNDARLPYECRAEAARILQSRR
jgi:DNA-binding winged helix-turn-helix (wHTH) protein/tetratricopeptide (TPR) repeat protein